MGSADGDDTETVALSIDWPPPGVGSTGPPQPGPGAGSWLILLTEVRPLGPDTPVRDERTGAERCRQRFTATDRMAALQWMRALSCRGSVRAGRLRVKIVALGRWEWA